MMTTTAENFGIGSLVITVSTLGLVFNAFGFLVVKNNPMLARSFCKQNLNHCIANFCACTIFLLYVGSMTLVQAEKQSTSIFGKICGQVLTFFWNATIYAHVAVSFDRMVAVRFPLSVNNTMAASRTFVLMPWIVAFAHAIPYFWYNDCYIVYITSVWVLKYDETTQCGRVLPLFNGCKNIILIASMAALDMVTLGVIRRHHKKQVSRKNLQCNSVEAHNEEARFLKKEILFVLQTIAQGTVFFFEQLNFFIISAASTNKYFVFFFTTFTWLLCHTVDGLTLCVFQVRSFEEQRKLLSTKRQSIASVLSSI